MSLATQDNAYTGIERRSEHRRMQVDSREMIRFEIKKEPRRLNKDRRGPKSVWDGRESF